MMLVAFWRTLLKIVVVLQHKRQRNKPFSRFVDNLKTPTRTVHALRMAQFVLKIEKLSRSMGPRASQDLRSSSLIMAPGMRQIRMTERVLHEPAELFVYLCVSTCDGKR